MNIAAIVIVYKPNEEEVQSNILQYIDSVDYVLVWRNSPTTLVFPEKYHHKIILMGTGENEFIAKPLNVAIDWCIEYKIDYLLTMDQDSEWVNFANFKRDAEKWLDPMVVIFAPNINNSFLINESPTEIQSTITSGSLHNVSILKKLGGFREDYAIYWVDGEFCFWARSHGYKIQLISTSNIIHKFGEATQIWRGIHAANYSITSYYYLYRNMLWMHREFPKGVSWKTILYTLKLYIPGILLGEKQKIKKISKIAGALFEGIFTKIYRRDSIEQ